MKSDSEACFVGHVRRSMHAPTASILTTHGVITVAWRLQLFLVLEHFVSLTFIVLHFVGETAVLLTDAASQK
jgi:hypothetical protein